MLDFTSLLLAAGLSGLCLSLTMIALWMTSRQERFLVTWACGVLFLVGHVIAYWRYTSEPGMGVGLLVALLLPLGFCLIHAAALHFFHGNSAWRFALSAGLITIALITPTVILGLDGVALILQNFLSAGLLALSARLYWVNRAQAPTVLRVLPILYLSASLSFFACGAVLLVNGQWVIGHTPDNWAERVNIVVSILTLTGAGALSIALNQTRLADRHKQEAITDALTGLLNRRALFAKYESVRFDQTMALAMFDLDHFKAVNDVYGHAVGDDVLKQFADTVRKVCRVGDDTVRLGGEEFAIVMLRVSEPEARAIAQRIADGFAEQCVMTPIGELKSTVSAGIGFGYAGGSSLDEVLTRADKALYDAKRGGRNRIALGELRIVS